MRPNNTDLANRPVLTPEQQEDLSQQLVKAVRTNEIERVNSLIEAGADVNKVDDQRGLTPLFHATANGCKKIVELLLNAGAEVDKVNQNGQTALFYATVEDGREEIVQLLIEKGADVNKYDRNHLTPFLVAFFKLNNSDLLKAVIKGILDGDNVGNLEFLSKQLEGEQIRNIIIDNSSKSDVKKLAVFASEEIQDLIVDHFNEKNLGNHIDTGEGSEVAILRELKSDYLTPSAENVSSSEKKSAFQD